jgi:uncharacterized protein YwgA
MLEVGVGMMHPPSREAHLDRSDLALMLMSQQAGTTGEQHPLDRIRVQKAIFLLTQRGSPAWRSLYSYKPYNWGPYSSQLAYDLDAMVRDGQLEASGSRYTQYRTTALGEKQANQTWASLDSQEREFIRAVRSYVTHKSFTQLLREVYAEYPEYATASQFTG